MTKTLEEKIDNLSIGVNDLGTRLDKRIDGLGVKMKNLSTELDKRIDNLSIEMKNLGTRLDKRIDNLSIGMKNLGLRTDKQINDLAIIVKKGFDDVYERFELFDERLGLIETKMVTIDVFTERMDRMEFRWNEHDRRIENLEDKVGLISRKTGLSRK